MKFCYELSNPIDTCTHGRRVHGCSGAKAQREKLGQPEGKAQVLMKTCLRHGENLENSKIKSSKFLKKNVRP